MERLIDYNPIVSFRDVEKQFLGAAVLKGVSLDINRAELVSISGHSGSGKSTILRIMQLIETPDSGQVSIFGHDATRLSDRQKNRLVSERIGVGFQSPMLLGNHSVWDNIMLAQDFKRSRPSTKSILELMAEFGLDYRTKPKQLASTLSGGEQMKVALVRSLASQPELVLLDEPTSAVDSAGTKQIFEGLHNIVKNMGISVVAVNHDADLTRQYCDREIVVEGGLIVA